MWSTRALDRTRSATRLASAELAKDERLTSFRSEWLFLLLLYRVDLFRLVLTRCSFVTTPDVSKNVSRDCHEHIRVMEMLHKNPPEFMKLLFQHPNCNNGCIYLL